MKIGGRSSGKVSVAGLIAARDWLTVFLLPAYAPELNPVEGAWSQCKRSMANLAVGTLDRLALLVRTRLKRLRYRPDVLDGFSPRPVWPSARQRRDLESRAQ